MIQVKGFDSPRWFGLGEGCLARIYWSWLFYLSLSLYLQKWGLIPRLAGKNDRLSLDIRFFRSSGISSEKWRTRQPEKSPIPLFTGQDLLPWRGVWGDDLLPWWGLRTWLSSRQRFLRHILPRLRSISSHILRSLFFPHHFHRTQWSTDSSLNWNKLIHNFNEKSIKSRSPLFIEFWS